MKTLPMVALTNVLIVVIVALLSLLWPMVGAIAGYGNSWWVAPLATFGGFYIAARVLKPGDPDSAFKAQVALISIFCFATLLWSLLIQNLGIPAWRVLVTLALGALGTWLGRLALGSAK